MSSIVTAVPSGLVHNWCVMVPWFFPDEPPQQCANSTQGTYESDFETICCDGNIIDMNQDLFKIRGPVNMEDLMCCRLQGPQAGGLMPLPAGGNTRCDSGTAVPLTSLAATNTNNAQDFLVTYTSASFGGPTPGDFIPTESPYCFWAYTKSGVQMTTITVPAAQITTLVSSTSFLPVYTDVSLASDTAVSSNIATYPQGQNTHSSSTKTTDVTSSTSTTQNATNSSVSAPGPVLNPALLCILFGLVVGFLHASS